MKNILILMLVAGMSVAAFAEPRNSKEMDRLHESGAVLKEILDIPDNIPTPLLNKAECVIVIPSVKKFAFGIGGSYGRGAMSCRSGENFTGRSRGRQAICARLSI